MFGYNIICGIDAFNTTILVRMTPLKSFIVPRLAAVVKIGIGHCLVLK